MALAAALTQNSPSGDIEAGQNFFYVYGTVTASASYSTGGDTLNLNTMTVGTGDYKVPGAKLPVQITFSSKNGYNYAYVAGTDRTNGKVKICTASNTELGAGAYPAGITGDLILFCAVFPKA